MLCLPSHTTDPPVYLQHFVSATKDILPLGRHHILLPLPDTFIIKYCPWNLCIVEWNRKTKRTRNTGGGWKWRCSLWVLWSKYQMCGNWWSAFETWWHTVTHGRGSVREIG